MSERYFVYDDVNVKPAKITTDNHDTFGPTTVFHDVPIAREIVQEYPDGKAYKPAKELHDAFWTAEGRWATVGGHPDTTILSARGDINGRMVNVRKTKSLNDHTRRPRVRGILADLEVFDNKVAPETLENIRNGVLTDVSIGFFFDKDVTPDTIDEDGHPLNGSSYDYVQRNLMIDHLAFGLEKGMGRCPFPACGIGADRKAVGDPFGEYEDFDDCVAKNQDKDDPEAYCATIERTIKERRKKKREDTPRTEAERAMAHFNISEEKWNNLSEKEKQEYIDKLPERGSASMKDRIEAMFKAKLDEVLAELDDLVEEEYQGNATWQTLAERAKSFFKISDEEWDALTDELKQGYIDKLPPEKKVYGKTNKDWKELFDQLPEDVQSVITDAGLCPDCDSDKDEEKETESEEEIHEAEEKEDSIELDPDEVMREYEKAKLDRDYPTELF